MPRTAESEVELDADSHHLEVMMPDLAVCIAAPDRLADSNLRTRQYSF